MTSNPRKAALPDGVEVAKGYLRKVETLPAALEGVDRLYLAPTPDTVVEVLKLARAAGVRHVVALSGEPEGWWGDVTRAVDASGLDRTHLWPADFMENSTMWAEQLRRTGAIREPYPDTASAPIAMDDIARVAATALLEDGHAGKAYPLGGPEKLTRAELARQLGVALGREIPFLTVSPEETVEAMKPTMGEAAAWYVESVLGGFTEDPVLPTGSVEEITGRPGTTFAEWAAAHTADFA